MAIKKNSVQRRKPSSSRRETVVKVLMTEREWSAVKLEAAKRGLATSTWLRLTALDAIKATK